MKVIRIKHEDQPFMNQQSQLSVAVIGSGISGLSAFWLLSQHHQVTLYEKYDRPGGHTNTVRVETPEGSVPVDTGFIVYNERNYPNLTAFFRELKVQTSLTEMSFAVSRDNGQFEYSGSDLGGLLAQKQNLLKPRFWRMLADLVRFYQTAKSRAQALPEGTSLGEFLDMEGYSCSFQEDHLLPMAAAIWSAPTETMRSYPLWAFMDFCDNHGLIQLFNRPQWRTVVGGSREYVQVILNGHSENVKLNTCIQSISRKNGKVLVRDRLGGQQIFDAVIIAAHADEALDLVDNPSSREQEILARFQYQRNLAVLHSDSTFMPRRKRAWASWNYLSNETTEDTGGLFVTYWMNKLQPLNTTSPLFLTLNADQRPEEKLIHRSFLYDHPIFDNGTRQSQRELWEVQGQGGIWYCGSYLGSGFHEDGIQAGLAVAEAVGGEKRPWEVKHESGRIDLPEGWNQQQGVDT
jgi:predicted NAD/FAD-binding protein